MLTETQHDALDRLAKRQPEAVVIAADPLGNPVVRYPTGARRVVEATGEVRVVK